jgi:hypothetical protein
MAGKIIPKVKFRVAPLDKTFPMIHYFLNPPKWDWDWSGAVYSNYPQLKGKLMDAKNKNQRRKIEYAFFKEIFQKEKPQLEKRSKQFQREWDKINDAVMMALSEVTQEDWSKQDIKISAMLSLDPIGLRDLKSRTIELYYKQNLKQMKHVAIHEIFHFIYFRKWKNVFPKSIEKEFEYPYLTWKLSEIVPEIVLNDKRIHKVFKYHFVSYPEYEKALLNGRPLLSYFQEFYDTRVDFEDFLKKSWTFVKKHEKEINAI